MADTSSTTSTRIYESPGHRTTLSTDGQVTASINAEQGTLPSRTAQTTSHSANTAGFNDTTSIPAKHDSSTNDATGWDSLSNGVHLAIYIAAPVVAFFLFGLIVFCVRRNKKRKTEAEFTSRTKSLRESFISSLSQLQAEKAAAMNNGSHHSSDPNSYHGMSPVQSYQTQYPLHQESDYAMYHVDLDAYSERQESYPQDAYQKRPQYQQQQTQPLPGQHLHQSHQRQQAYHPHVAYVPPPREQSRQHYQQQQDQSQTRQFAWNEPYCPPPQQWH